MSHCSDISDISTGVAEVAGKEFHVSASSIRFLKTSVWNNQCHYTIDTSVGPKECPVMWIGLLGNKYLAHAPAIVNSLMCGW